MSSSHDSDTNGFLEVIAYLHGVADGVAAGRRGSAPLAVCHTSSAQQGRACASKDALAGAGRDSCEPSAPGLVAWSGNRPRGASQPRELEATRDVRRPGRGGDEEPTSPTLSHRTLPYLSNAASMDPAAASEFPADDRVSGVCMRVVPLSPAWYALTGTSDGD